MNVHCVSCNEEIFEFLGGHKHARSLVEASDFKPLDDSVPPKPGGPMVCPKCGKPFYAKSSDGGHCLFMGEGTWWPHPPVDQTS